MALVSVNFCDCKGDLASALVNLEGHSIEVGFSESIQWGGAVPSIFPLEIDALITSGGNRVISAWYSKVAPVDMLVYFSYPPYYSMNLQR